MSRIRISDPTGVTWLSFIPQSFPRTLDFFLEYILQRYLPDASTISDLSEVVVAACDLAITTKTPAAYL